MACVNELMSSYNLYSAILALKLLGLAALSTVQPFCTPDKAIRASVSDLKHLTPFWVIAAVYLATNPDPVTALTLLRMFVVARILIAMGYVLQLPKKITDCASCVSFLVTGYMGGAVVYFYRNSL